jgi:hypothetical protein
MPRNWITVKLLLSHNYLHNCQWHAIYYNQIVEANFAWCLSFYMIKIQWIQVFLCSKCWKWHISCPLRHLYCLVKRNQDELIYKFKWLQQKILIYIVLSFPIHMKAFFCIEIYTADMKRQLESDYNDSQYRSHIFTLSTHKILFQTKTVYTHIVHQISYT